MIDFGEYVKHIFALSFECKVLFLSLIIIVLLRLIYQQKFGRSFSLMNKIPQIKPHIILGNLPIIAGGAWRSLPENFTEIFGQIIIAYNKLFIKEDMYVWWNGWRPQIVLNKPEIIEIVLSSNKVNDKEELYDNFRPWLGTGLFTSNGNKWRMRRKMLTPAFHFKILNDFIPIINEQTSILIEKLLQKNGEIINDLTPYITSLTLDIICETAMGVKINVQNNPESEYVKSLHYILESLLYRGTSMLGIFDWIFYRTKRGKEFKKRIHDLHEFTDIVIKNRKREFIDAKKSNHSPAEDTDSIIGQKKRLVFLDLLLENHFNDNSILTENDIREEVDTFMFGGHDTVLVATTFALYLLGLNMEIQQKVYDEIIEIFDDDDDLQITGEHLKRMRYTECCIKEALRIYPSAPFFGRHVMDDIQVKQYTIPKGSSIFVMISALHDNPEIYPNPQVFNPDRFLPENISRRHPYAYLPFSAGTRNCIGQKYALIEEKIIISSVIKKFIVKSLDERDKLRIGAEIVSRPKCPLRMQFIKR